jgi:hypothetical protein
MISIVKKRYWQKFFPKPLTKWDRNTIIFMAIVQCFAFWLLVESTSTDQIALIAVISTSTCQAAIDFYESNEGKRMLSAGFRIIGIVFAVGCYAIKHL